jgi:hypothetical protein
MSTTMGAVAFTGFLVAWWLPSVVWRPRCVSVFAILITGHTLTTNRQLGVLLTVVGAGLVLQLIYKAANFSPPDTREQLVRISSAMVLLISSFIGLAWVTKLTVSGVDFTFAVDWLPGRLHKELWWIVAGATVLNCLMPLIIVFEMARSTVGESLKSAARLASRLAVLRFIATIIFTTGWMINMGDAAASARLQLFVQDGFIWLILAVALAVLAGRKSHSV